MNSDYQGKIYCLIELTHPGKYILVYGHMLCVDKNIIKPDTF